LSPAISFAGGNTPIDPDLDQPYTDEVLLGFEREVGNNFAVTVNLTWREDGDLVEDVAVGLEDPTAWAPLTVPDPGPDQILGNGNDQTLTVFNRLKPAASALEITNPPGLDREYKGVELIANKRLANNWQGFASVVWQEAEGSLNTDWGGAEVRATSASLTDPNSYVNRGGPVATDREWQFKLGGNYIGPWGINLGGFYQFGTGIPLYRTYTVTLAQGTATVVADPWDTFRGDDFSRLDLRAEKAFSLGERMSFAVMADVFNVFNENNATSRSGFTGSYNPTTGIFVPGQRFERAMVVQPPRLLRLGARLRF
jgi:hypothetical protein